MNVPNWLRVYGDQSFRGKCAAESVEQVSAMNQIRKRWPDTLGAIVIHPRNEGKYLAQQIRRFKAEGMTSGASDIIIPGSPAFVCELKRKDHTKSRWQEGQLDYLKAAHDCGAFTCVAFGAKGVIDAILDYLAATSGRS